MNSGKKYDVKTFALFGAFMGLAIALIITIVSILILPEIVKEVADIFAEGGIPTQDQIDSAEKICWIIFWIINVVSWVYFAISLFLGLWLRHLSKKATQRKQLIAIGIICLIFGELFLKIAGAMALSFTDQQLSPSEEKSEPIEAEVEEQ